MGNERNIILKIIVGTAASIVFWMYLISLLVASENSKHEAHETKVSSYIQNHHCKLAETGREFHEGKLVVPHDGYLCDDGVVHFELLNHNE